MNTTYSANNEHIKLAESYYGALLAKDFDAMASYLHPEVHFIGPLAEMRGKDAVVAAARNLSQILKDIHIRARFATAHQVMLAYDFSFSAPLAVLRTALLMEFTGRLIAKIELFYDGRPFVEKSDEIFGDKGN